MSEVPSPPMPAEPRRPPPDPSWRERLEMFGHRVGLDVTPWRAVLAGLAVVVAIVSVLFLLRPSSPTTPVEATLPRASPSPASSPPVDSPTTAPAEIVVQAAGAVAKPGVYRIAGTARVNDLVAMAGGFAPDADPDQVELAAPLTDGERVYVPRAGEQPPPVSGASSGSSRPRGPIDLNRATESDLESLPGIGPALAQAIINHREQNGPFRSVDELADVRGIGQAKLDLLRPLVKV